MSHSSLSSTFAVEKGSHVFLQQILTYSRCLHSESKPVVVLHAKEICVSTAMSNLVINNGHKVPNIDCPNVLLINVLCTFQL